MAERRFGFLACVRPKATPPTSRIFESLNHRPLEACNQLTSSKGFYRGTNLLPKVAIRCQRLRSAARGCNPLRPPPPPRGTICPVTNSNNFRFAMGGSRTMTSRNSCLRHLQCDTYFSSTIRVSHWRGFTTRLPTTHVLSTLKRNLLFHQNCMFRIGEVENMTSVHRSIEGGSSATEASSCSEG